MLSASLFLIAATFALTYWRRWARWTRFLRRARLAVVPFFLATSVFGADNPKPPAPEPLRSVTLRVMPESVFFGSDAHFRVTSLSPTTCTVQVDAASLRAQGEPLLIAAFRACWNAKPEAKGCRTLTLEDGSRVRAVVLASGSWSKDGCDQGKVKPGKK